MFAERPADGVADTAHKTDLTAFCARRCVGRAEGMPERRRAQQQEDILIPQRGRCPSVAREGEKRRRGKAAERGTSDKRPRLSNSHEQGRQREAVIIMQGVGTKADGGADTALIRLGSAQQCLDTAFSSDRGGAERVKHSGGGLQRNGGGVGRQPERSEV